MVSTSYPLHSEDWRGRFIEDMVNALAQKDELALSLWAPLGNIPDNVTYAATGKESAWLQDLLSRGGIAHMIRSGGWRWLVDASKLLHLVGKVYLRNRDVDVVHVNWLQNALPLLGTSLPAVITVLGSDFGLLRLPGMSLALRMTLRRRKAVLAPNADWMIPELERRFGDIATICPIPFGVDARWFEIPRNGQGERPRKWVVVSRLTRQKIGALFSWGKEVFRGDDELHLFGPMQEQMLVPEWVHYHGSTHPAELREHWFPKAAGLITLSQHDEGRPQVILEAMAARLPVLASDIPAHRNIIVHRQTGWLADTQEDLESGLSWLSNQANNASVGLAAQQWVKHRVGTWEDCAGRLLAAYELVLR